MFLIVNVFGLHRFSNYLFEVVYHFKGITLLFKEKGSQSLFRNMLNMQVINLIGVLPKDVALEHLDFLSKDAKRIFGCRS